MPPSPKTPEPIIRAPKSDFEGEKAGVNNRDEIRHQFHVTVAIPLYNKRPYIAETLRSALSQTHSPFEILVVDDESDDGSDVVVLNFTDSRVRLIRQKNSGPGAARNRAIAEATTEWIAFLDADDLWQNDHLAELSRAHRCAPDAAMLSTSYEEFDGVKKKSVQNTDASAIRTFDLFAVPPSRKAVWTSAMAVRRDVLLGAGGFRPGRLAEDVDLWIRLGLKYSITISSGVTALYRRETGGLTEQYLASAATAYPDFLAVLRAAASDPRCGDRRHAIVTYACQWHRLFARQAIAMGDRASARRHLTELNAYGDRALGLRILTTLPKAVVAGARNIRSQFKRRA